MREAADKAREPEHARRAIAQAGWLKLGLGLVITAVGPLAAYIIAHYTSGGLPMVAFGLLMLAQGLYLVYRGWRQVAVSKGELRNAVVVAVRGQATGTSKRNTPLSFVLDLEIDLGDGAAAYAKSTNVFGERTVKGLEGETIQVLWSPRYPMDAAALL